MVKQVKILLAIAIALGLILSQTAPTFAASTSNNNKTTKTTPVYVTAQGGLNIRAKANKNSKKITAVSYGTKLHSIGKTKNNKWHKIKYKGKIRYVHSAYVNKKKPKKKNKNNNITSKAKYSASAFRRAGVIHWGGYRWTWYSQRVLPGGGLKIPGRHVDGNGYVCDGSGYICIASGRLSKGTIISTPLGKSAKVYDYCGTSGTIDVYVNW